VTVTVTGAVTVTAAVPLRVASATDTAVIVIVAGDGTLVGALYRPTAEIVPTVAFPPVIPFTCQVTAELLAFATDAAKACEPKPAWTVAVAGVTDTPTGAVIVSDAEPDCAGSMTDTAVTVTVVGIGAFTGAEYAPADEIVPTVALPPAMPLTCQLTAELTVLPTVAVKVWRPMPAWTVALAGVTDTDTGGVMVSVAAPDCVGSATETAVTVTAAGDGTLVGAL
jgi:hypothetical protein